MTGGSSRMTRRPSTTAVSDSKARMPSRRRALVKIGLEPLRGGRPRRGPGAGPVASAASRMSASVIEAYQTSMQAHAGVAGHPLAVAADGGHRRRAVLRRR